MFDIGMTELLLIGIVALIVIGPKDLPVLFHTLGRFTARARSMAREFSKAMNDAAKESGMDGVSKDLKSMTSSKNLGLDSLKDAAGKFEKWDPKKSLDTDSMGPATKALTEERAEAAKKISEAAAKKAEDRIAKEKAAEAAAG
ncbi:MAG: Sec-independent protein translocase protein TatB, partial [Paracoccaceae bacterium]|nr:Sec-independent protein translocase protein TatB [Paracoccaceae bacterium]